MAEEFDYFPEEEFPEETSSPQFSPEMIWNILTGLILLGSLLLGLVFMIIFVNPQSGLNPLPPTTLPALVNTHTPSPTPRAVLPPTWTPTIPPTASPTPPVPPSNTPSPPTQTPQPTATPQSQATAEASFVLQEESPTYTENFVHEEEGCQWMGVAGQVFDEEAIPVDDILVTVKGRLGEDFINKFIFTGMATEYGEGGYEVELSDTPMDTQDALYIQLLDQTNNLPLSEQIYFETYDDCDRNLIIINFVQETG